MIVSSILRRWAVFDDRPVYDTSSMEWCKRMRSSYQTIADEYSAYVASGYYIPANKEVDPLPQPLISMKCHWRVAILRLFYHDTPVINHFPRTAHLIKSIMNDFNIDAPFIMISILEPGAGLAPHVGYYKGVLRYHLGLSIPLTSSSLHEIDSLPLCHMKVDNHTHVWSNGGDILFDDCYVHEVRNRTNQPRIILLMDIPRPFHRQGWASLLNRIVLRLARVNDGAKTFYNNINRLSTIRQPSSPSSA
jgi:aspartyl/asparaginyl beta-hydroxylase (cupin superfamily)